MRLKAGAPRADSTAVELPIRRRLHVRVYIGALLLIPLFGFTSLFVSATVPRARVANRASAARERMQRAVTVLALANAVAAEHFPAQVDLTATRLGFSRSVVKGLIGFDPVAQHVAARRATDAALRTVAADPFLAMVLERRGRLLVSQQLQRMRADFDAGHLRDETLNRGYRDVQDQLRTLTDEEFRQIAQLGLEGTSQLMADTRSLMTVLRFRKVMIDEHEHLLTVITASTDESVRMRIRLAELLALEAQAGRELASNLRPSLRPLFDDLTHGQSAAFVNSMHAYVDGRVEPKGHVVLVAAALRGGLARAALVDRLVDRSMQVSLESASVLARHATGELRLSVVLSLLLVLLSIGSAAVVSRAIVQPLRALAARARRVALGQLDEDVRPDPAPREIAMVSAVVEELAANLSKVQRQAVALAKGSLDDRSLDERVPGQLGELVNASVDRLRRSIIERELLEEQLTHQATYDSLTGLPNRAAALLSIDQALARLSRKEERDHVAVLFLDLDDFKRANDERGHAAGDEVLKVTATRIAHAARSGDVVARLGGDEFLVIAESVHGDADVRHLGERIIEAVSQPIELDGFALRVGASVGYALAHDASESGNEILRRADLAMYRAKGTGRGRVVKFDEALNRSTEERIELERAIAAAMACGELGIEFQPVLDATTGALCSVEALLRWHRPGHGPQAPARFIPILESSPAIVDIGRWVLRHAALRIAELRRTHPAFGDLRLAVNLSGRHLLHKALLADVEGALEEAGLEPAALTVEITETAMVTDLQTAVEQINQLHRLGVRVAIDDFGTGYTSIGQLSRLPVDVLKIDRGFVGHLDSPAARRIVELVIEVGHTLGLTVIAEGVEDPEQRSALEALGCDQLQGFLLARPMSVEALIAYGAERAGLPVAG